jgi:hypothetical protein
MKANVHAFMKRSRESSGGWDGERVKVTPGMTKDKLKKKIAAAVARLQQDKQERNLEQNGTRLEVKAKLTDAMVLHTQKVAYIKKTEENIQSTWASWRLRKKRWKALQL